LTGKVKHFTGEIKKRQVLTARQQRQRDGAIPASNIQYAIEGHGIGKMLNSLGSNPDIKFSSVKVLIRCFEHRLHMFGL
jgi:hypothetical protein